MHDLLVSLLRSAAVVALLMTMMPYMTWFERRILAAMQVRVGPDRAGWQGLLQPLADGLKLLFKEDVLLANADRPLYRTAPAIALFAALAAVAVIPFGPTITVGDSKVPLVIADLDAGVLYLLGVSSLGVYALVLGGWSSGSKYSLIGALRAAAQVVSYELVLGLALVAVVLTTGSTRLSDMVAAQQHSVPFLLLQPVAFLIYLLAACAETNRAPFDLPEAETELVAGYHTEYSGMRFALYFIAEYVNMIVVSALAATMFLGGWLGPFWSGPWWLLLKIMLFMFAFVWLRATLPRLRYDQLMRLSWNNLIPIGLINLAVTAIVVALTA
jgi:NADH-quinone oxidoreductase subunit H